MAAAKRTRRVLARLGRRLLHERFSLDLTPSDLAQLLGVDAVWVRAWETERHPLPSSYLCELGAMGMDTTRLTLGHPAAWLPGALLPDERLLRYCWRGLPQSGKTALRRRFGMAG